MNAGWPSQANTCNKVAKLADSQSRAANIRQRSCTVHVEREGNVAWITTRLELFFLCYSAYDVQFIG